MDIPPDDDPTTPSASTWVPHRAAPEEASIAGARPGRREILPARGRRRRAVAAVAVAAVVAAATVGTLAARRRRAWAADLVAGLAKATVRRANLQLTVVAPGRIESAQKTLIECELENLTVRAEGGSMTTSGATTILELKPEGSTVRRDDVICRLDSADYEEVARQQRIAVQGATADVLKAELDLKAAEMSRTEFAEGTHRRAIEDYSGKIALAESDVSRREDRLRWARGMLAQGFYSATQLADEEASLMEAMHSLRKSRGEKKNFETFGSPITRQAFDAKVLGAVASLDYQRLRLQRGRERLARFERNVDRCTIHAPHDGVLIYANEPDDDPKVEVGSRVLQKQDLFYLPDLTRMIVQATLHESVVDRVRPGQPARVRVDSLPDFAIDAHVTEIATLPEVPSRRTPTLMNFTGTVVLASAPKGLLPGMSAQVEVVTGHLDDVLVVPAQAVSSDHDRPICYVSSSAGLERREVKVGQLSRDLLEIVDGLEEGEQVVLEPGRVDPSTVSTPVEPAADALPATEE